MGREIKMDVPEWEKYLGDFVDDFLKGNLRPNEPKNANI